MRWRRKSGVDGRSEIAGTVHRLHAWLYGGTFREWGAEIAQVLGISLVSATLVLATLRMTHSAVQRVVVFDVIKYANAQRAVAARFISGRGAEEVAPVLLDVSRRTRGTIREVAGSGTIVVIRQSIVEGETRDITDEVLTRLGLPINVPTADPTRHVLEIAPTLLGVGPQPTNDPPHDKTAPSVLP